MFNLEVEIQKWRGQMRASGVKAPALLDELESHLRDDVEQQSKSGIGGQEAFAEAVQRLGPLDDLKAEFSKTGMVEMRDRKLKIAAMVLATLGYAAPILLNSSHILQQMDFPDRQLAQMAFGLTIPAVFSGLVIHRFLPVITNKPARTRIQATGLVAAGIWFCGFMLFALPHLECTEDHLKVLVLWAILPVAVAGGFSLGLDEAVYRRRTDWLDRKEHRV